MPSFICLKCAQCLAIKCNMVVSHAKRAINTFTIVTIVLARNPVYHLKLLWYDSIRSLIWMRCTRTSSQNQQITWTIVFAWVNLKYRIRWLQNEVFSKVLYSTEPNLCRFSYIALEWEIRINWTTKKENTFDNHCFASFPFRIHFKSIEKYHILAIVDILYLCIYHFNKFSLIIKFLHIFSFPITALQSYIEIISGFTLILLVQHFV